jgi:hypothetical protein
MKVVIQLEVGQGFQRRWFKPKLDRNGYRAGTASGWTEHCFVRVDVDEFMGKISRISDRVEIGPKAGFFPETVSLGDLVAQFPSSAELSARVAEKIKEAQSVAEQANSILQLIQEKTHKKASA